VDEPRPIGARLREARMRQGLEISECAAATRIRERYLVAIEDDRFESLPDPAYVSGFVRAYASHLGVEVEGPERMLPSERVPVPVRPRPVRVSATRATARGVGARPPWWRWPLVLLVLAAAIVVALVRTGAVDLPSGLG
jgi:cytoskeleton protein RodZ